MKTDDQDSLSEQVWTLQETCAELEAIAHLFRLKRRDDAPPLDMDRINWGLSRIFGRMARQIKRASRQIEETEFKRRRQAE